MDPQKSNDVLLYVYDLSRGLAKAFSPLLLGKEFPGVWHTAIVVYGQEYFFGGNGIGCCIPGGTQLGPPNEIIPLGRTEIPNNIFQEYISSSDNSEFAASTYNIFNHNCNHFSNEIAMFLTGNGIPEHILNQPNEFLATPFGQVLKNQLEFITVDPTTGGGGGGLFNQQQKKNQEKPATPLPVKCNTNNNNNSIKEKETKKMADDKADAAAVPKPPEGDENDDGDTCTITSARRAYKYDDPPIVFKDVDGMAALKKVEEMVVNFLNPEQLVLLKEFGEYLESVSGAWAIGDEHLDLISFLLNGGGGKFAPNVVLLTLEVLQAAALKEDVVLILHQDRKEHRIMSYVNKIENLTLAEQEEIVKLLCNLCGQPSTIDWLMYISEWSEDEQGCHSTSNSRVTIRAAVHTLLNDQLTTLQRNGVYLIYNLSLKEVFEDVAIELATAVLQYMHSQLPDDQALLCLTAVTRFIEISMTDVPALVKMLGPDLNRYKGKNEKMDKLVEMIEAKVSRLPSYG